MPATSKFTSLIKTADRWRRRRAFSDQKSIDFLDFGASAGGSIELATTMLDGDRGIGIDIDLRKIRKLMAAGHDAVAADITRLAFPENAVRFVVMSHILEHLPGWELVEATLESGARVANDFLYIAGPYFDPDSYLEEHGLKFYWSDWHGHPCHVSIEQVMGWVSGHGFESKLFLTRPLISSLDDAIHPLESVRNQHGYDVKEHPPKPLLVFPTPFYREFLLLVHVGKGPFPTSVAERIQKLRRAIPADHTAPLTAGQIATLDAQAAGEATGPAGLVEALLGKRRWSWTRYCHQAEFLASRLGARSVLLDYSEHALAALALAHSNLDKEVHVACSGANEAERCQASLASHGGEPPPNLHLVRLDDLAVQTRRFDVVMGGGTKPRESRSLRAHVRQLEKLNADHHMFIIPWTDRAKSDSAMTRNEVRQQLGRGPIRGCYWSDCGGALRVTLQEMSDGQISEHAGRLARFGRMDVRNAPPQPGICAAFRVER